MDSHVEDQYPRLDFYDAVSKFIESGRKANAPASMLNIIESRLEAALTSFLFCAPEAMQERKCIVKEHLWSIVLMEVRTMETVPAWVHAMGRIYQGYIWQ